MERHFWSSFTKNNTRKQLKYFMVIFVLLIKMMSRREEFEVSTKRCHKIVYPKLLWNILHRYCVESETQYERKQKQEFQQQSQSDRDSKKYFFKRSFWNRISLDQIWCVYTNGVLIKAT